MYACLATVNSRTLLPISTKITKYDQENYIEKYIHCFQSKVSNLWKIYYYFALITLLCIEFQHFSLKLIRFKGPTKNWIAVEGSPSQSGANDSIPLANYDYKIASSAPRGPQLTTDERNVFAIYVSYYIKVKLALSGMGGEVTLKLPFILGHIDDSLGDNQDHDDDNNAIAKKKLDNKNDDVDTTAGDVDNDDVSTKPPKTIAESTSMGDVNNCKKNCRNDDDTGANGIKNIEKCRNKNGLSIDVMVDDASDRKNEMKNVDASTCSSSQSARNSCNETERNINVVTAQIHSSAI